MFGTLSSTGAPDQATRDVRMVLDIISLLTDREATAADIRAWLEAGKQLDVARKAHDQREAQLLHRERACEAAEKALAKRTADVVDREQQAKFQMQRVEQAKAEIAELKADLRKAWAA
jgi:hypothetical protein